MLLLFSVDHNINNIIASLINFLLMTLNQ